MNARSPPGAVRDSIPISLASSKASSRSPSRMRYTISVLAFAVLSSMGSSEETLFREPESSDFGIAIRGLVGDPLPLGSGQPRPHSSSRLGRHSCRLSLPTSIVSWRGSHPHKASAASRSEIPSHGMYLDFRIFPSYIGSPKKYPNQHHGSNVGQLSLSSGVVNEHRNTRGEMQWVDIGLAQATLSHGTKTRSAGPTEGVPAPPPF